MSQRLATTALATLLLSTLAAPAGAIPPPPKDLVFVTTFHAAIEADDENALSTLVQPTARFHVSGHKRETQTLTEFRETMQELYAHMPAPKRTYTHVFSSTWGHTAASYRISGMYDGTGDDKGKAIDVDVVEHFRLENNRIAEMWYHFNHMMFSSQLGLQFKPYPRRK